MTCLTTPEQLGRRQASRINSYSREQGLHLELEANCVQTIQIR